MESINTLSMNDRLNLSDDLVEKIKRGRFLASSCIKKTQPITPHEAVFYKFAEGNCLIDPFIAYYELKTKVAPVVARYMSTSILEEYCRTPPIIECSRVEEVTTVSESATLVAVLESEEHILTKFCKENFITASRVIANWQVHSSLDSTVRERELCDMISYEYPSRVRWTDNLKTYNDSLAKYKTAVHSEMRHLSYENQSRVARILRDLKGEKYAPNFDLYNSAHADISLYLGPLIRKRLDSLICALRTCAKKEVPLEYKVSVAPEAVMVESGTRNVQVTVDYYSYLKSRSKREDFDQIIGEVVLPAVRSGASNNNFASVPIPVYLGMRSHSDYDGEMFASSVNVTLPLFCSPYKADMLIGSVGSFFDMNHWTGKWLANPPYTDLFFEKIIEHFEKSTFENFSSIFVLPVPYSLKAKTLREQFKKLPVFRHSSRVKFRPVFCSNCYANRDNVWLGRSRPIQIKAEIELIFLSTSQEFGDLKLFEDLWDSYSTMKV
jgi:hypothetical protein